MTRHRPFTRVAHLLRPFLCALRVAGAESLRLFLSDIGIEETETRVWLEDLRFSLSSWVRYIRYAALLQ